MPDPRTFPHLSGQDLAALGRKAGPTQAELARRAGTGRQSVICWEKKLLVDQWGWAPKRMIEVLGVRVVPPAKSGYRSSTPVRGNEVSRWDASYIIEPMACERERLAHRAQAQAARRRIPCGAKTRKGRACRLLPEPGRSRCKFHGGMFGIPLAATWASIMRCVRPKSRPRSPRSPGRWPDIPRSSHLGSLLPSCRRPGSRVLQARSYARHPTTTMAQLDPRACRRGSLPPCREACYR